MITLTIPINLTDDIQLLNCDLVYLVQDIDAWDVNTVALNNVNQIITGSIVLERHVSIRDFVLGQNSFHSLGVQFTLRNLKQN